ncbi:cell division protein FtsL [Schauerella aestuarii]|uniref:cell division protein FtsL n=1 Tax=Schauerella aestuarii TaxID=2511204 RepID=UPI0013700FBE|nr:cell division protein FtsL [Achromobacter aestuarii]MYZ42675.1 cell division protein FtsL [Achromobacter aestuarii]
MGRASLIVATLLMLSAISLVSARYQSRQLFIEYERAQSQARELEIEWRRMQVARAEFARNTRVDQAATGELGMMPIAPERTIYLQATAQTPSSAQTGGAR